MAPIDASNRDRREIQPEECEAVGKRWLTASEREVLSPLLVASTSSGTT